MKNTANALPEAGFVRIHQIIGCRRRELAPLIPISSSTWWKGIADGRFPPPVRFSQNVSAWRVDDIRQILDTGKWSPATEKGAA